MTRPSSSAALSTGWMKEAGRVMAGGGGGRAGGVCGRKALTLEEGADLPPGCDAALAGVLAQRHFQKEHWDAAGEEEDEVGEEEGSCRGGGRGLSWQPTPQPHPRSPQGPKAAASSCL